MTLGRVKCSRKLKVNLHSKNNIFQKLFITLACASAQSRFISCIKSNYRIYENQITAYMKIKKLINGLHSNGGEF